MIKHIVCFKLKDRADGAAAKDVLLSMRGRVPQIRELSVYLDELHSERSFDIFLEVLLDDWAALDAYQLDGYHCGVIKEYMLGVRSDSIALDFEV